MDMRSGLEALNQQGAGQAGPSLLSLILMQMLQDQAGQNGTALPGSPTSRYEPLFRGFMSPQPGGPYQAVRPGPTSEPMSFPPYPGAR